MKNHMFFSYKIVIPGASPGSLPSPAVTSRHCARFAPGAREAACEVAREAREATREAREATREAREATREAREATRKAREVPSEPRGVPRCAREGPLKYPEVPF